MTAFPILDEHYLLLEPRQRPPRQSDNAAESSTAGGFRHHDEICSDTRRANTSLGTIQEMSPPWRAPDLALTHQNSEHHLRLRYLRTEKDPHRQVGASSFLSYLDNQARSIAELTTRDLEQWALTPIPGKGNVPNQQAIEGAKALCALAATLGLIDARRAQDLARYSRPQFTADSLRLMLQNPSFTRRERECHIRLTYQNADKNPNRQAGANGLMAYLESQDRSLAEATTLDVEQWALTLIAGRRGKGNLPSVRAFEGAKGLCALAAEVGYIDAQRAKNLAQCTRPQCDVELLRIALQNPALTRKEREYKILLNYQIAEKNPNRQAGANAFQAYLENHNMPLAELTTSDLQQWALTPIANGGLHLPTAQAFEGAKALCALALKVGHINAQKANDLAECTRPQLQIESLRTLLQNPALTSQEREYQLRVHYQSQDDNTHRQMGANSLLVYLKRQGRSLSELTKTDLEEWALTPNPTGLSKGNLPGARAFDGAKAFCALAAEAGQIDAQNAQEIAACARPPFDVESLRCVLQNPALTHEEREYQIRLNFQSAEKHINRQAGASAFLAYLHSQAKSLAEVTTSDLEKWALTPINGASVQSNLPSTPAFEGAKALCVLAIEVGHINAQNAEALAACTRPSFDEASLRKIFQNPALTSKEREYHICLNYQSTEKGCNRQAGARGILHYLESQQKLLAEITSSDLQKWALTPIGTGKGKGNLLGVQTFEGAKALCALAARVGHIDTQKAKDIAACTRPPSDRESLRLLLQNPALSPRERDYHIHLSYQSADSNPSRLAGANALLAHLQSQAKTLAEVTTSDLVRWALRPLPQGKGKGNLPHAETFLGAKALCALAAQVGHIDAQTASEIAQCSRPRMDLVSLRTVLQNPALSGKDREHHIRLHYQSTINETNFRIGANGILDYLERQGRSLAEITTSDLERWALTPLATGKGKNNLPSARAFKGAKDLCALAGEVGHIDAQTAGKIATCPRPHLDVNSLRQLLQNPALTPKEREYQIRLNYQSMDKDSPRQAGAKAILAYLERQERSLVDVTKNDVARWAHTRIATGKGKGNVPSARAFQGALEFCALAAKVGYLNPQGTQDFAECSPPQPAAYSASTVAPSQYRKRPAESSTPQTAHQRLRSDDQAASTPTTMSFAFPHSDDVSRELAISRPLLLPPHQHFAPSEMNGPQTLFDQIEALQHVHDPSMQAD